MVTSVFDRAHYAALDDCVYLNQASLGLVGRPAVSAMHSYLDEVGCRGNLQLTDADELAALDSLRERAAALLHADPECVAVLSSASELLGQVPMLVRPADGSQVLVVESDFPAVTRPWLRHAATHAWKVRFVQDSPSADLTGNLLDAPG